MPRHFSGARHQLIIHFDNVYDDKPFTKFLNHCKRFRKEHDVEKFRVTLILNRKTYLSQYPFKPRVRKLGARTRRYTLYERRFYEDLRITSQPVDILVQIEMTGRAEKLAAINHIRIEHLI